MLHALVKNWWVVAVVGVLAIILGIYTFFNPGLTLAAMVAAFGAYALISGIVQVVGGVRGGATVGLEGTSRTWLIVAGAIGVIAGIVTFVYPGLTVAALYTLVAVWAVLAGLAQVAVAIVHRKELSHTWLVALGGVASLALGAYLLARPAVGLVALVYAVGIFALIHGVFLLAGSLMLKRVHDAYHVTIERAPERAEVPSDRLTPR